MPKSSKLRTTFRRDDVEVRGIRTTGTVRNAAARAVNKFPKPRTNGHVEALRYLLLHQVKTWMVTPYMTGLFLTKGGKNPISLGKKSGF